MNKYYTNLLFCTKHYDARSVSKHKYRLYPTMTDKIIKMFANKLLVEQKYHTYRELMSLGTVRGMRDEPTQMIESVVQVHPEGHLNIRFDWDS